eukprot:5659-Chlamydomonas_euryale.AAC.2
MLVDAACAADAVARSRGGVRWGGAQSALSAEVSFELQEECRDVGSGTIQPQPWRCPPEAAAPPPTPIGHTFAFAMPHPCCWGTAGFAGETPATGLLVVAVPSSGFMLSHPGQQPLPAGGRGCSLAGGQGMSVQPPPSESLPSSVSSQVLPAPAALSQ